MIQLRHSSRSECERRCVARPRSNNVNPNASGKYLHSFLTLLAGWHIGRVDIALLQPRIEQDHSPMEQDDPQSSHLSLVTHPRSSYATAHLLLLRRVLSYASRWHTRHRNDPPRQNSTARRLAQPGQANQTRRPPKWQADVTKGIPSRMVRPGTPASCTHSARSHAARETCRRNSSESFDGIVIDRCS
jgi:hypothetical protein